MADSPSIHAKTRNIFLPRSVVKFSTFSSAALVRFLSNALLSGKPAAFDFKDLSRQTLLTSNSLLLHICRLVTFRLNLLLPAVLFFVVHCLTFFILYMSVGAEHALRNPLLPFCTPSSSTFSKLLHRGCPAFYQSKLIPLIFLMPLPNLAIAKTTITDHATSTCFSFVPAANISLSITAHTPLAPLAPQNSPRCQCSCSRLGSPDIATTHRQIFPFGGGPEHNNRGLYP